MDQNKMEKNRGPSQTNSLKKKGRTIFAQNKNRSDVQTQVQKNEFVQDQNGPEI